MQYLIERPSGCKPMDRAGSGLTVLHEASRGGRIGVVKYLADLEGEKKVDCSCQDEYGNTPLHIASRDGQLSVVRLLVEDYQCDPAVENNSGIKPADMAQTEGHTDITSYLSHGELLFVLNKK